MRYHQPYGVTDESAPYINGDPSIARQGSIIPAEAIEFPQREAVALIEGGDLVPDDASLAQILYAVRSQRMNYALAVASGSADIVAVEFDPPIANTMTPGMPLRIKAIANNTGPTQLSTDGILHALRHADGSELIADEIKNGVVFGAVWNDTGYWEFNSYMGGTGGGTGGGTVTDNTIAVQIPFCIDTGTQNSLVAPFTPAITTLYAGLIVEVRVINDITGPAIIRVNTLNPVPILRGNGAPLQNGDAVAGQIMLLIYSAAQNAFQFSGLIPKAAGGLGPVGSVVMCAANTPFAGLLKLNGALLVRAEHPLLWTFANASGRIVNEVDWQTPASRLWSSFSRGDGVSTFRLPDFRAEFLRFWDDGRGVDASRILGQQQKDQVGEFTYSGTITSLNVQWLYFNETGPSSSGHSPTQPPNYWGYGCPIMYPGGTETGIGNGGDFYPRMMQAPLTGFSGQVKLSGNSGLETRTRNIVVTPCIVDG